MWAKLHWDMILSEHICFTLSLSFRHCSTLIFTHMLPLHKRNLAQTMVLVIPVSAGQTDRQVEHADCFVCCTVTVVATVGSVFGEKAYVSQRLYLMCHEKKWITDVKFVLHSSSCSSSSSSNSNRSSSSSSNRNSSNSNNRSAILVVVVVL